MGKLSSRYFNNGHSVSYLYNDSGQLTDVQMSHDTKYAYSYDNNGKLYEVEDRINQMKYINAGDWVEQRSTVNNA